MVSRPPTIEGVDELIARVQVEPESADRDAALAVLHRQRAELGTTVGAVVVTGTGSAPQ